MTRTITRLFDSHTDALSAVDDLERAGVPHERIALVSNGTDNWHKGHLHSANADRDGDGDNDTAEGAAKGATTGGLIGGGAGLLAGLGMLAIPGLGPVVAAGWLVSTAVGAAAGAAAGGATGGLLGALKDAGHSDEEAGAYAEGVRRGGTLVSVRADDGEADRIQQILDGKRGTDGMTRAADYRADGWTAFDPQAQPYSREQIDAERQRYAAAAMAEPRSFSGQPSDGAAQVSDDLQRRPGQGGGMSSPIRGSDA